MTSRSFRLAHLFPTGSWRVAWIGRVGFVDRLCSAYQPSIEIFLSRASSASDGGFVFRALNASVEDRTIWTRVGYLPLLQIGSIWKDGAKLSNGNDPTERFFDVEISQDTTRFVKAGQAEECNGNRAFYLPQDEHPWHMNNTQSWCVCVSLPDARRLIIPCAELLRFYFGSSSNLLARMFRIPLSKEMLYRDAELDRRSGDARIVLAGGIGGNAAADIARIAFDPLAWRAANHIGASLVRDQAASRPAYVRCGFPFEGITDLTVTGQWVSFRREPDRTFVVHSIRSCSHEFPFSSLRYRMDWQKASTPSAGGEANQTDRRQRALHKRLQKALSFLQQDPSGKLAQQTVSIGEDHRFPDLLHKPVWKEQLKSVGSESGRDGGCASPSEHLAVGDHGGSGRGTAPLELALSAVPIRNRGEPPDFVSTLVEQLSVSQEVTIQVLTSSGPDGWTFPVRLVVDNDGVIDQRCLRNDGEPAAPRRRYSVLRVEASTRNGHVLALEGQGSSTRISLCFVSPIPNCNVEDSISGWIEDLVTDRRESYPISEFARLPGLTASAGAS